MADERISVPRGWSEAEYDSDRPDVRQAKQPAVFEHESGNLAVFVRPDDPGIATAWRVEVATEGRENFTDAEVVGANVDDRAAALKRAREVMEILVDHGVPEDGTAAALSQMDWRSRLD